MDHDIAGREGQIDGLLKRSESHRAIGLRLLLTWIVELARRIEKLEARDAVDPPQP